MSTLRDLGWRRDLVIPLGILLVPLAISAFWWDQALLLLVPVAFVVGWMSQPRHPWMIWIGATVLMWIAYGTAVLSGFQEKPASDPSEGETVWTFAAEAFIWMALLVLLPLWIGRFLGSRWGTPDRPRDLESGTQA